MSVLTAVIILMVLVIGKMCIRVCVYTHVCIYTHTHTYGLPLQSSRVVEMVKTLPTMRDPRVWSLGWVDPLEMEMATHSSLLAWKMPWTEEPDGLQSMGSQRVGCDLVTKQQHYVIYLHIYVCTWYTHIHNTSSPTSHTHIPATIYVYLSIYWIIQVYSIPPILTQYNKITGPFYFTYFLHW